MASEKPTTGGDRSNCERALELIERGWSQRRIAKHLGIGKTTVQNYFAGEYGGDEYQQKREHLQGLELACIGRVRKRLDKALCSADDKIAVMAGMGLLKASERRCKLLGLDAPTKTQELPATPLGDEELLEQLAEAKAKVEARLAEKAQANGKVH